MADVPPITGNQTKTLDPPITSIPVPLGALCPNILTTPPPLPEPDELGGMPNSPQSPTPQSRCDGTNDLWMVTLSKTNDGYTKCTPAPASPTNTVTENDTADVTQVLNPRKTSIQSLVALGGICPKNNTNLKMTKREATSKYLNADMLEIHDAHVSAIFDLVDIDLRTQWDEHPEGKLAIIPFGIEIASDIQLRDLRNLIFTTIAEITQSQKLGVSTPSPNKRALDMQHSPTTFLVYNLSVDQCQTLQQRKVWALPKLTFRVTTIDPCLPNFLFAIGNFTTMDTPEIKKLVLRVWTDDESREFFNSLTQAMETDEQTEESPLMPEEIQAFIKSLKVTVIKLIVHVPMPTPENPNTTTPTITPRFNIYVDSSHIWDFQVWTEIRLYLAKRTYQNKVLGQGITYIAPHNCGICHSVNHPRGLCQFPSIPGWNGPQCQTSERWGHKENDCKVQFPRAKRQRT